MKKVSLLSVLLVLVLVLAACSPDDFDPFQNNRGTPTPLLTLDPSMLPATRTPTPAEGEEIPGTGTEQNTPTPPLATPTPDAATPTPALQRSVSTATPAAALESEAYLASNLMEAEVRDRQDQVMGQVVDFIAEWVEREVHYGVISVRAENNTHRDVVVPYAALDFSERHSRPYVYYMDVSRQELLAAPDINLDQVNLLQAGWDEPYRTYWAAYLGPAETPTPTPQASPTPSIARNGHVKIYVLVSTLHEAEVAEAVVQATPTTRPAQPAQPTAPASPTSTQPPAPATPPPALTLTPTQEPILPTPTSYLEPTPTSGVPGTPAPTEPPTATPAPTYAPVLYRPLLDGASTPTPSAGRLVLPLTGRALGEVYDIVMDPQTGEMMYILVEVGSELALVPIDYFGIEMHGVLVASRVEVILRINRSVLATSPVYTVGTLPDFSQMEQ
jgi:sporulation protein YlmC with PRC-barrel domain